MPIPSSLQSLLDATFAEMHANPHHRISPQRRRQIYDLFVTLDEPILHQTPRWLAILTAQRVLPIFRQAFPDDPFPKELLDAAIAILQGHMTDAEAAELQDYGYHASGNAWGYDETETPWYAMLAADTAYHALKEARGCEPLKRLGSYQKFGVVRWPPEESEQNHDYSPYPEPIRGDTFTDEDVCQVDDSDAAATAAVASACEEGGPYCDPERLETFWAWWLTQAIPTAIEAAKRGKLPTPTRL